MLPEESVNKAVEWWANKITSNDPHDNGDTEFASFMACRLADSGVKQLSEEQVKTFKEELTRLIKEQDTGRIIFLGCDYNPDNTLSEAGNKAGINVWNFPFKTHMRIEANGTILVADGYAKPYVEI